VAGGDVAVDPLRALDPGARLRRLFGREDLLDVKKHAGWLPFG
jgi:hypothetical protein